MNGTKASMQKFSKPNPTFTLKRTFINSWKTKFFEHGNTITVKRKGRPSVLNDTLLKPTKDIIVGTRNISRKVVVAIGAGVVTVNDQGVNVSTEKSSK